MRKIKNSSILVIVLSLVVGFLAGIVGYSFADLGQVSFPFLGQVDISGIDLDRQIIIDQPRSVIVDQDLRVKQIENNLLPTLFNIYHQKGIGNVLNSVYLPSEILGQGFVLTADGWVVTTDKVITNLKGRYVVIGYQSRQYALTDFIKDEATGIVFGKIDVNGLSVASLGKSDKLINGQTLVVVSNRKNLRLAHIKKIGYNFFNRQSVVQLSEDLNKEIFLDIKLDDSHNGAIVANFKGEIVGIISNSRVILVNHFNPIISRVLNNKKIIRPKLDLKYIDLAQVEGLINLGENGALVYSNPLQTSPAYGKLKNGDIIKKVDDVEINVYQGLSELINTYRAGDKVELLVLRKGKEIVVEVELD